MNPLTTADSLGLLSLPVLTSRLFEAPIPVLLTGMGVSKSGCSSSVQRSVCGRSLFIAFFLDPVQLGSQLGS